MQDCVYRVYVHHRVPNYVYKNYCNFAAPTLFFDETLPSILSSSESLLPLCTASLPSLPASTVSVYSAATPENIAYSYCEAETARGTYISRSVSINQLSKQQTHTNKDTNRYNGANAHSSTPVDRMPLTAQRSSVVPASA